VIDEVRMTILQEGKDPQVVDQEAIVAKEFGESVPFEVQYAAPTDNHIREVRVELIPSKEALAASPNDFPDERVKHQTRIICRPKGVMAYYPPGRPPVIETHLQQRGPAWHVRLRTRTSTGYATIATRYRGAGDYVVLPPQSVSDDGQELTFRVSLGEQIDCFTVTPFATETGSAEDLTHAIEHLQFAGIEVGDPVEVSACRANKTNVVPDQ